MNLNELAAQFGGKPVEAEEPKKTEVNELAAKFGGKPVEEKPEANSLAAQFGGVPVDTKAPKPDELGRYDAAKQETKLDPEEEAKLKEEYGISSEMGNVDYAGRLLKRAGKQAAVGIEQSFGGLKQFGNDILGLDNSDNQKNLDHLDAVTKTLGSPESHAAKIVEGAVSSIIQQVPLIVGGIGVAAAAPIVGGAALATAGAAEAIAGGTALTGMFVQSFGQTYDESRREGLDLKDSTIRSGLYGTLEVVGEKFGLGAEIKALKASAKGVPTKELAGYFAKALSKEVPGEELTYAGQFAVDKGYGMNPEAGLQEFFEGAADTLAATVVQGGIMMGAGAGVNKGVQFLKGHLDEKQQRAEVRDIYKQDLEAKGEKPTKDQLDTIVDNHFKVMAEQTAASEENKGEENAGTGNDTGTTDSSLQLSEQETGNEPSEGTTTSTTGSLGGDQRIADTAGAGEETKQDTLDPEVKARATNYLASIDDKTIIPTARTVNSIARDLGLEVKKGAKMANTIEAIKATVAPVETQQNVPTNVEEQTTPIETYFDTKNKLTGRMDEIIAENEKLQQETTDLKNKGIDEGDSHKYDDDIDVARAKYEENGKEFDGIYKQIQELEFPSETKSNLSTPSNVTAVPNTPEFEEHFRDSKVRDENGEMIPLYHGTTETGEDKGIAQFKVSKEGALGEGVYMSPQTEFAGSYAEGEGGNVLPVFADIRNPLVIHTDKTETGAHRDPAVTLLEALGVPTAKAEAIMEKAYENKGGLTKEVSTRARKLGYDGIFQYKNGVLSEVVAFSPNDIKSALNPTPSRKAGISNTVTTSPKENELSPSDPLLKPVHPEVEQAIKDNNLKGVLNAYKTKGNKFLAAFAKRLSELGLTTNIYLNNEKELVRAYIDKVKGQRERFLLYIEANYPDAYKKYFEPIQISFEANHPEAVRMQSYYFNFILAGGSVAEKGKLVKVDLKPIAQDLADLAKMYRDVNRTLTRAAGSYFDIQNAININPNLGGNTNHTVIHEITHAATHWAINNPDKLDEKQRRAVGNLQILYQNAKAKINKGQYGFTDIHEFISEAFSNPEFQKELRALKTSMRSDQTMWSKFIQLVGQIFGTDNVLFHTMANADVIFSANKGSGTAPTSSETFADQTTNAMPTLTHKGKEWEINPGERDNDTSTFGGLLKSLIKSRPNWADVNKENVKDFLSSMNETARRYYLGVFSLDQLTDMSGPLKPQFKEYVRIADAMISTRNHILKEGEQSVSAWSKLIKENPVKANQLSKTMLMATMAKMDPEVMERQLLQVSTTGMSGSLKQYLSNAELRDAWEALVTGKDGAIAVKIYKDVRSFYERRMNEYQSILRNRLIEREQAKGTDPKEIAKMVADQRNELDKDIIQPYFPLKRFGEYWIQRGTGLGKTFMQFETAGARNQAAKKLRDKLARQHGLTPRSTPKQTKDIYEKVDAEMYAGEGYTELSKASLGDSVHLSNLKNKITEATAQVIADPNAKGNELNSLSDLLKDSLDQYLLEIAPNESIKKMFLHRDNIQGASGDMLRAFSESRQRIAYQRSRFEYMPELFQKLDVARIDLRKLPYGKEQSFNRALVRELELNLKNNMLDPVKQAWWSRFANQFGFLHFLTSPASAIVNTMQIPGIYIPFARAKYGTKPVLSALNKYRKMLGGTGYKNATNGQYEFLSLARSKEMAETPLLGADGKKILVDRLDESTGETNKVPLTLLDAYNSGVELGAIDVTASHTVAGLGDSPSKDYTGLRQKFMYYVSLPFHSTEKLGRELTYMATFELAFAKHIKTVSPTQAYKLANQDARDLVQKTMFNYNTINKPRYFRGNLVSIVSQFKMYPQQMTVLMASSFHQSLERSVADEREAYREHVANDPRKEELIKAHDAMLDAAKKEAFESFWGMIGMTLLTSGLSGLPLYFIFTGLMSAFHAAFGDSDEPFDADNWFKNWCHRTFGGFVGDSLSRGVLSQATGANFADRMSVNLTDMWFPSTKQSKDEVGALQNTIIGLMGPTVGAAMGYAEALKRLNDGHYERAMEAMLPAGIKNIFVGTRYLVEGKAITLKGDTLDSEVTAREAVAQMLGFSPEDTAQKQKAAMELKNQDMQILARKQDLENAYFIAFDTNDSDMQQRVIQKIIKFDHANPEPGYRIDAVGLQASIKKKYENRVLANITGGVNINKNAIGRLNPMRDYSKQ